MEMLIITLLVAVVHLGGAAEAQFNDRLFDAWEKGMIGFLYLGMTCVKAVEMLTYAKPLVA